ncbi:MAG: 50S ribosomal protein L33 [Candidatus Omnitrophota bacterium]
MREHILLACSECKSRWYSTSKNKKNTTARLELVKFCRNCHRRTPHKEIK